MKLLKVLQSKTVFAAHRAEPLPTALSYKIYKFLSAIRGDETFYAERLQGIIKKYNANIVNGKLQTTDDKQGALVAEVRDLENVEVDAPDMVFTIDELSPIQFSVAEIETICDFILE